MATIYGEKKGGRRKKLVIFMVGLAVGAVFLSAYYKTKPEPEEVVVRHSDDILGALEILSIEYSEALENGNVIRESEYEGAKLILGRVIELFEKMKPYAIRIHPELAEDIERDLGKLSFMINETSPIEDVDPLIEKISEDIKRLKV